MINWTSQPNVCQLAAELLSTEVSHGFVPLRHKEEQSYKWDWFVHFSYFVQPQQEEIEYFCICFEPHLHGSMDDNDSYHHKYLLIIYSIDCQDISIHLWVTDVIYQ